MWRFHRAGIKNGLWNLVDDLVSNRTAAVRVSECTSEPWEVENGIGQGAVLFLCGFLFTILVNGLTTKIKRACSNVLVLM